MASDIRTHRCTFDSAGGLQFLTFGNLRCECGRVKPYEIPGSDEYRLFRSWDARQPGSAAAAYFFFRLPIPAEAQP